MTAAAAPAPAGWRAGLPFAIVTLIWGSTWLVIRDQLGTVSPSWSVTYRFAVAAAAMFALATVRRERLWLAPRDQLFALGVGVTQFVLNYNLVYRAEAWITSGVVALLYALLIVPNALLGWLFVGQRVTRRFLAGSAIALAGVALLLAQEWAGGGAARGGVLAGIALALGGVLSASVSNVMQASDHGRALAMPVLLGWAMLWGAVGDALVALAVAGPPAFDPRPGYWAGVLYLGLAGSAVAFSLYFTVIRRIGAARAAYTSVLSPVIAMLLSTLFEDYRWSAQAAAGCLLASAGLLLALRAGR